MPDDNHRESNGNGGQARNGNTDGPDSQQGGAPPREGGQPSQPPPQGRREQSPRSGAGASQGAPPSQGGYSQQAGQGGAYGGPPPQHGGQGRGYQQGPQHSQADTSTGLDENVAAALSYLLGWITGLLFYFIEDDNEYIRFHAMQSILLSVAFIAGYFVLWFVLGTIFVLFPGGGILWAFLQLLSLAGLAVVVIMMIKAYNGEWFTLPVIGDIAMDKAPPSLSQGGQRGGSHHGGGQQDGWQGGRQGGQQDGWQGGQQDGWQGGQQDGRQGGE